MKHGENGSILTFDSDEFASFDDIYNHKVEGEELEVKIDVEFITPNPEGTEGTEGSSDGFYKFEKKKKNANQSPEPSEPSEPSAFPPKCYRCDFSRYETKQDYESHCILRHPGKPAYPGPADIKQGLTPQGMSWENAMK